MPIDRSQLTHSALFKHFWTGTHRGLSHQGLDEVSREGALELERFAKEHEADGTKSAPDAQVITPQERETMAAILEDSLYGSLFEIDARPMVTSKFGIETKAMHVPSAVNRPTAAAPVELPARVSRFSAETLSQMDTKALPDAFNREYDTRRTYFEDPLLDTQEKGKRLFGLLRDYAKALWAQGQQSQSEQIGRGLLDAFRFKPYAAQVGEKDFSGIGFSAAQSVVLGIDPLNFKHAFPDARNDAPYTYLAMDGAMAPAMKYVNAYLRAKGVASPQAEAFEQKSVLAFMLGQPTGHTKHGVFNERQPFSTSGLNWGTALFPHDAEVEALPVKPGFEFSIDLVDAYGDLVHINPTDKMEVRDEKGNLLTATKVIQRDAAGNALSWSAVFLDAQGKEASPFDLVARVIDATGRAKGDGKANGVADIGWWGFCDRNTAQQVFKAHFAIPQLDREVVKVRAGNQVLEVPLREAQRLIDVDVPDLAPHVFAGHRFHGNPQTLVLKNGRSVEGKIQETDVLRYGPGTHRESQDNVRIYDVPGQPMLGSLTLTVDGSSFNLPVAELERVVDEGNGKFTVMAKSGTGWRGTVTEKLPWSKAVTQDGKRVLVQDGQFPIRGALTVGRPDGSKTRLEVSDIDYIAAEMMVDTRFSQYVGYVSQNNGVYATDSVIAPLVSNGTRWVNKLELDEKIDGSVPEWVPEKELTGLNGKLEFAPGDKVVFGRGMFRSYDDNSLYTSFSGWYQVRQGRVVNEGFLSEEPDFAWGPQGPLNWTRKSTFNPHMDPELRLALLVNGVSNMNDALATRLNLPANWKSYLVDPAAATVASR
ncbi:MAG: hypothetical protein K1X64_19440 [Myxococcaceae bacterium]|nr:hypothetical protein [Myxococcaceae bacterium]